MSKPIPRYGWKALKPGRHERTIMRKKCGSKCFLGPSNEISFPICEKNTCKTNEAGIYAAYLRAREYGSSKMHRKTNSNSKSKRKINRTKKNYKNIAKRAKRMLTRKGYKLN